MAWHGTVLRGSGSKMIDAQSALSIPRREQEGLGTASQRGAWVRLRKHTMMSGCRHDTNNFLPLNPLMVAVRDSLFI